MRKKDLLAAIPDEWPEENMARIIRSGKEKVLMILLPSWDNVSRYPRAKSRLAHFLSEKRWLTYYDGSWSQESMNWLSLNTHIYDPTFDEKSREAIAKFTGMLGTISDVEYYETNLAGKKKMQALNRKQERINYFMKSTPALPGNFRKQCIRTLGGQKKIAVKLFQPLKDGTTIERIFKVERSDGYYKHYFHSKLKDKIVITELCRAYTDTYGDVWNKWYYGEYYNGYGNRQEFWDRKSQSVCNVLPRKHYVYDNLDELDMTPAQRSTLRIMTGLTDPAVLLNTMHFHPEIEKLAKIGAVRLASEMHCGNANKLLKSIRKLPKRSLQRVIDANGGIDAVNLIGEFPGITDKNLKEFSKIKDSEKAHLIILFANRGWNVNHLMALWKATGGIKRELIREYEDYLDMASRLGHDVSEEIIYRNKRWREWHNRYVEEINHEKNKEADAKDNRKYSQIRKDYKRNEALFGWKDKEYIITVPHNAAEINREGRLQHHCVGGLMYKDRMNKRETYIVFLRKIEAPDQPYYTIECTESKILQAYGAYDRKPDKKTVDKILGKWMRQVRKNAKKAA